MGRSDVGKSALINALLGQEKMPTSWTPTTSIAVYLKNIKDRPSYMNKDVYIFKASNKDEKFWNESKLDDKEYCSAWELDNGTIDILKNYGTRQGNYYNENEAGAAVIFIDAPILEVCDIIDLPGFGTGDRTEDDTMSLNVKNKADILIYMSIANGFMRSEDIEYLKESIPKLVPLEHKKNDEYKNDIKPLSNLFIVASQAQVIDDGNHESLDNILNNGCNRLLSTMPKEFWNTREEVSGYNYTNEIVRSRFFTYTTDIKGLRSDFEDKLSEILKTLPLVIERNAKKEIHSFAKKQKEGMQKEIEHFNGLLNDRAKWIAALKKIKEKEPETTAINKRNKEQFWEQVDEELERTKEEFENEYNKIFTKEHIIRIIKDKDFKKNKEDIKDLSSYLNSECQINLEKILKNGDKRIKSYIDKYLKDYQTNIDDLNLELSISANFNVPIAFASGLAGLTAFGALAFWASTFGNLGAYILVAKGVSILSAIGISVGGTAAAVAAVASIGGPITIGIGLAVLAGLLVFNFFSDWKESIAKKIIKEYESKQVLSKYSEYITEHWYDTRKAFNAAVENLDKEWKKHIDKLAADITNCNADDLEDKINKCKDIISFFENIPL
ncbi:dynamin family protein [Pectinatus frisingensis]|uniref:dynamin family protein n=1 Tax=Pectinatus frisingensis TaxID=865 RepID=UPI003D808C56